MTEQTMEQIRKMILAYLSDINESRFRLGNFSEEEQKLLNQAVDVMEKYSDNLILVKMPNPSIELVKTIVRENCLTKDIGYVFYDYIFIGPALLEQFRGFSLRNDEVLLMFTTALKDLAVELNVAMFTSTQVNASADDNKNIRNEASLAGGRATINKADNGAIMARPTPEELESLEEITKTYGIPNCVTDIFKCRSGEWTQVRIWSQVDLGRLKKKDLFVTDARLEPIADFFTVAEENYEVHEWDSATHQEAINFLEELNGPKPEAGKKVSLGLSEYY
jgi:replicative DNA helicase